MNMKKEDHIITVNIDGWETTTKSVYKYDYSMVLYFPGGIGNHLIHIHRRNGMKATVRAPDGYAKIPDRFFTQTGYIYCDLRRETDQRLLLTVKIPVLNAVRPGNRRHGDNVDGTSHEDNRNAHGNERDRKRGWRNTLHFRGSPKRKK